MTGITQASRPFENYFLTAKLSPVKPFSVAKAVQDIDVLKNMSTRYGCGLSMTFLMGHDSEIINTLPA